PHASWPWLAYAGALAAVNGDTWATEIGVLSSQPPRLITTLQPVERGASGGITPLGTVATLAGAGAIGLCAALLGLGPLIGLLGVLLAVTLAGLVGGFTDSLLGATLQALYRDPKTGELTEKALP